MNLVQGVQEDIYDNGNIMENQLEGKIEAEEVAQWVLKQNEEWIREVAAEAEMDEEILRRTFLDQLHLALFESFEQ